MPTFNQGIRTEAGQDLFGRVDSGQTKIHYTKIVYSSLDLSNKSDDDIRQMTDVNPKELIVPNPSVLYKPKTATTDPETEIRAIGSNEILQKGFYINTYALFASDDSGHEILLGVTLDDHPSWLPAYDGVRPQALTYNWDIGDKDSNNVKFTDANDAYATYADLQQYSSAIDYSMNQKASGINNSMSSYSNTFDSIKSGMANDSTISNLSSTANQNSNNVAALFGSTSSNASNLATYSNELSNLSDNMADNKTLSLISDSTQDTYNLLHAVSAETSDNTSNVAYNSNAITALSNNVSNNSSNLNVQENYAAELAEEIGKNSNGIYDNSTNISQLSESVTGMPNWSDENATRSQANDSAVSAANSAVANEDGKRSANNQSFQNQINNINKDAVPYLNRTITSSTTPAEINSMTQQGWVSVQGGNQNILPGSQYGGFMLIVGKPEINEGNAVPVKDIAQIYVAMDTGIIWARTITAWPNNPSENEPLPWNRLTFSVYLDSDENEAADDSKDNPGELYVYKS